MKTNPTNKFKAMINKEKKQRKTLRKTMKIKYKQSKKKQKQSLKIIRRSKMEMKRMGKKKVIITVKQQKLVVNLKMVELQLTIWKKNNSQQTMMMTKHWQIIIVKWLKLI